MGYLGQKGRISSKTPQSWQGEGNLFDKLWNQKNDVKLGGKLVV